MHVALNQLRRLVNAVIEVYGRPTQIAIELLRDVKMGTDDRMAHINQTRKNEAENARLDAEIMETLGAIPVARGEARRRWRLWKEQEERCIYTGRNISASDLFKSCDIDHIVPRSRGGLERGDNEVVCLATVNRRKGDRTPYEAFHLNTDPEVDWDQLTARVQRLYQHNLSKRRRFSEKASQFADDDGKGFLPRQFGDASYAARMALSYLRLICPNVWATRGQLTHSLRRMWGLRKDRDEHANHFVDAAVIAMTDRARVNLYSRINALGRKPEEAERLPWPDFQKEIVNQADKLVPVMRPQRTPSGELHNQTLYSVWRRNEGGGHDRVPLPAGWFAASRCGATAVAARIAPGNHRSVPGEGLRRCGGQGGGRQHHRSGVRGTAPIASPNATASAWRRRAGGISARGGRAGSARAPSSASTARTRKTGRLRISCRSSAGAGRRRTAPWCARTPIIASTSTRSTGDG